MKTKLKDLLTVLVFSAIVTTTAYGQAGSADSTTPNNGKMPSLSVESAAELQSDLKILESFGSSEKVDFAVMRSFIERGMQKWRKAQPLSSLQFTAASCSALKSRAYSTREERAEAQKMAYDYATRALKENKVMPSALKFSFLVCLLPQQFIELRASSKENLGKVRLQSATQWVDVIHSVESEIDFSFDVNDQRNWPVLTVMPPPGSGIGVFGVTPSVIKEPTLRQQYEQDIEKNRIKGQKLQQQIDSGRLQTRILTSAKRYLVEAYRKEPKDIEELKTLLATIKDSNFRQSVINEIEKPDELEELRNQEQMQKVDEIHEP